MTDHQHRHRLPLRGALLALCLAAAATCGDEIVAPEVWAVAISPDGGLAVGLGSTVLFSAEAFDRRGSSAFTDAAEWSIEDTDIATISSAGLATAVAEGTTSVTATVGGVSQTVSLEVYLPEIVSEYVPGTSYFGRKDYVEYIPGELPVVLSAPHDGDLQPDEIADRSFGVTGPDRNTRQLTFAVRDALVDATGYAPHVVISHLHRSKLDPNREVVEAAQEDAFAERAWEEFHGFIESARITVVQEYGGGMYFDMHGHGHPKARLELGYLLSSDRLNQPDGSLNALGIVQLTSVREIGRTRPESFAEVLRGATSLGGYLEAEGVAVVPSPGDPMPLGDPYFSGGYSTRRHGSFNDTEVVSGIQIEHHFPGLRDTDENRRAYAEQLAAAIEAYVREHFGFFEPT